MDVWCSNAAVPCPTIILPGQCSWFLDQLRWWKFNGRDSALKLDDESATPPRGPSTDWLSAAQRGVFTHYLPGLQNNFGYSAQGKNSSWSQCVSELDAGAYAADVAATGARWAVLLKAAWSE